MRFLLGLAGSSALFLSAFWLGTTQLLGILFVFGRTWWHDRRAALTAVARSSDVRGGLPRVAH